MKARRLDPGGTAALAGNVVIWGVTPVLLRALTSYVDAWTANGIRYPLSAACYWPLLFGAWLAGRLEGRLIKRALVPAFFALGGQILWALAPYYIEASLIGFLIKVSMVWALAGAMILFPEERALLRSGRFYLGLLLAVGGFATLAAARGALEVPVTREGVMIILACSAFFGLYGVSVRKTLSGVHPLLAFGVVAQFVSAGAVALMVVLGDPGRILSLPLAGWLLAGGSSLLGIGISHVLFYTAIHRLGATLATSMHLLGPFITLGAAHLALGEAMGGLEWLGGLGLVAGGAVLLFAQETVLRRRREIEDRACVPAAAGAGRVYTCRSGRARKAGPADLSGEWRESC